MALPHSGIGGGDGWSWAGPWENQRAVLPSFEIFPIVEKLMSKKINLFKNSSQINIIKIVFVFRQRKTHH